MNSMARAITLHLPGRVETGVGSAARLGDWARGAERAFVLASQRTGAMTDSLGLRSNVTVYDSIPPEPKDSDLVAALDAARSVRPDLVIGLGGGSVMDIAKLVAVLWDSTRAPEEIVGSNRADGRSCRLALVPTTAGTGSEAGIRALFTDSATGMKAAVESPHMLADIAVLDPEFTLSVPPDLTAATGIDALAHCVEAFTNIRSHPLIDDFARMGISLVGKHLGRAVEDGSDLEARAGMLLASFYGGICLGPVNTAAGHAIAYPLGTRAGLPHGLANALIFPHVFSFNAPAVPEKTQAVLSALRLGVSDDPAKVLEATKAFCRDLGIDMSLSAHGVAADDLRPWSQEAHGIRRLMDNNPRQMNVNDIEQIYRAAY